jgi:prepilin-type processing-associated H-X9-DG protein
MKTTSLKAFSLLELVIIIALVSVLMATLSAGLAHSRPNGRAVQCLNNLRQVTGAWTMYAEENSERVVNNFIIPEMESAITSGRLDNWSNNEMSWGASSAFYNVAITNQIWAAKGPLGPYLHGNISAYKCPADVYLSPAQIAAGFKQRIRSISMNSVFGHATESGDATYQNPPRNWASPQYRQYVTRTSVPKPAKTWLFIDEHPDSINDGYFLNDASAGARSWGDIPACYHNGGCGVSFADGHAAIREWLSTASRYLQVTYGNTTYRTFDSRGREDFAWYLEHTGYLDAVTGQPQFGY